MAISTVKSLGITNLEAGTVMGDRMVGNLKTRIDRIAVATTSIDEVNDVILLVALPSHAILTSIVLFNDDLDSGSALAADLRVFYSGLGGNQAKNGNTSGTLISSSSIATAITTLQAANTTGVEILFEANDIVNIGKQLWEVAGLTEDCGGYLYLGLRITTVAGTPVAGDIVSKVAYI